MRDKLAAALAALLTVGTLAVLAATSPPAAAASAEAYSWRNVEIAGGGFVPGIVFNRTERDLIYARTDIGGAYRWNPATGRWVPLLDWVGWDDWGYNGVVSLATDPVEPDRVYVAAGMYTNSWDPHNGAILRSADRGATWQVSPLPFKLGGNMPGRGMGERLAVDPNRNSVLYLGAPSGNGLWRSTDSGATWARVTSFPNPGTYVQDPNDPNGYLTDNQGVVWVTFDETTGSRGAATRTIYVGVADKDNTVYRSIDAGATWARLAGQPTGFLAHKGVLADGSLYIATSDTGGPVRRRQGRRVAVRDRDRCLDPDLAAAVDRPGPVLRLQWTDGGPAAPRHADGGDPGLLVARRDLLPLHRRRRDVDAGSGISTAIPTAPSATAWTSRPRRG